MLWKLIHCLTFHISRLLFFQNRMLINPLGLRRIGEQRCDFKVKLLQNENAVLREGPPPTLARTDWRDEYPGKICPP
jgi:hypothetical protein